MADYITTYTKKHFTPLSPRAEDMDIRDIAHALSLTVRANGHFPKFHSVAQHCIECAREAAARGADPRMSLLCLLHDASEAYIADVTTPVKRNMPEYTAAEKVIQDAVYKKFTGALPDEREKEFVRLIDKTLFFHEFYHFMGEKLQSEEPETVIVPDFSFIPFEEAEREFLELYAELSDKLERLHSVKVIGLDLDGTLLREDKTVSPKTIAALEKAAGQGIEIVPASGRSFEGIPDYVKQLPGVHYLVTTNGADVYTIDGERIYARSMPCADAADIARRLEEKNIVFGAYIDGRGYMGRREFEEAPSRGISETVIDYFRTTRTLVEDTAEFIVKNGRPVQIITPSFWDTPKELQREITGWVRDYSNMIYVYGSPHNIDITHSEASKGFGLLSVARNEGGGLTACFGDSENDADMLKKADFGFAMSNGDRYAKEAADFVAPSNEEDGIAYIIERLILSE